jgi:hypothetical protein
LILSAATAAKFRAANTNAAFVKFCRKRGVTVCPEDSMSKLFWCKLPLSAKQKGSVGSGGGGGSNLDLITAGRRLIDHLDAFFEMNPGMMEQISEVRIENQIGPIATRMKCIQGMLTMYFLMKRVQTTPIMVRYVSSSQKLKVSPPPQSSSTPTTTTTEERTISDKKSTTYKDRKLRGIELCRRWLGSSPSLEPWKQLFEDHNKKDDLADSLLQGMCKL